MAPVDRPHRVARTVLAILLLLFGLWIAAGLIPALVWAMVIAIAIDPLYVRAERRWPRGWRGSDLLPALVTLGIALLVIVPVAIGIVRAAHEAHDAAFWLSSARANGVPLPDWVLQLPVGSEELARWWQYNLATPQGAAQQFSRFGSAFVAHSQLGGRGLLHRVIIFLFTMIALFFVLRDRDRIAAQLTVAGDRLLGEQGERLGRQIIRSVRGTIDGLVLVGIGEGVVMTIVYIFAGVPHPLLLGALTGVAAIIPFGAAVMFAIAALLLFGQGAAVTGIAVFAIGMVVVGIADHFVRPVLIGSATRLPFLWVLVGIVGGLETLGLLGLFVGPATMAVLIMLWRELVGEANAPAAVPLNGAAGSG